ncbi:NAD(P)/FAD-dependent oxidoreductase [Sphingobacterium bovistauri]|uniref:FAD-dependent oxidoreductase n=1 Tax=Sphingobacterium bovistauri TaxID=2781959 RepID=A0ABS7Z4K9_9SPHI|nr:FAD-dependent oxidoreductase [Sphingobacterium bovistauri]MCA5003820.1 FAD-dependent oxidoreductase [Sphingobacterium bovistauri]
MKKGTVVIIGAGIAGLSTAYYLVNQGWNVQIIEQNTLDNNCSYGNAGMIVPSHFTPMASPGMISQGIRWMFDKKSPFYVRPSLNFNLMDWGFKFMRYANKNHVSAHVEPLRDLNVYSSQLYDSLSQDSAFNFELEQNGIMMLYKTKSVEYEEKELAKRAQELGLDVEIKTAEEMQALESGVKIDILGGILYKCDGKLNPMKLMKQLVSYLKSRGVIFHEQTKVKGYNILGNKIKEIVTDKGNYAGDEFVLCPGSYLMELTNKLHLKLPLMPGKGYSFMYTPPTHVKLEHAALLLEAKVAVTPMDGKIRFGGTMELGSPNNKIYKNRVEGIVNSIPKYLKNLSVDYPKQDIWYGYRPCPPDGLPYLGRTSKYDNVTIAAGGGMMGLSLGPAMGKSISDILSNRKIETNISVFSPDRFG